MLQHHLNNKYSVEFMVEKCHAPAICFNKNIISLDKIDAPDTETLKEAVVKDLSYVYAMDWSPLENKKW